MSTDIHYKCYSRVQFLTQEIDKLSETLTQKAQEYTLQSSIIHELKQDLKLAKQENQQLNLQLQNVCDKLKEKTVEAEDYKSKYNKMNSYTIKDFENKINQLIDEITQLTRVLRQKDQDLKISKEQFVKKTEQYSETLQQQYHIESQLKVALQEKSKYINLYNQNEQKVMELEPLVEELRVTKSKNQELIADIDQIRSNYGELYEQKTQEREKYLEQMEVQRQLLDYTMEDIANKYNEYLNEQVMRIQQECERKIFSLSSKVDCQLSQLQNDLETKRLELENVELARTTMEKTYNAAVAEDLLAREEQMKIILNLLFDSLIMDLKAKNEIIQDIFDTTNQELKRWTDQLLTGQILGIDGKIIMEQAVNHLNQRNQQLQVRYKFKQILKQKEMERVTTQRTHTIVPPIDFNEVQQGSNFQTEVKKVNNNNTSKQLFPTLRSSKSSQIKESMVDRSVAHFHIE